ARHLAIIPVPLPTLCSLFFFTDPAPPQLYTLSLHDALPISADFSYVLGLQELVVVGMADGFAQASGRTTHVNLHTAPGVGNAVRSEEHTSELQSLAYLVCRLLLEKKKYDTTGRLLYMKRGNL